MQVADVKGATLQGTRDTVAVAMGSEDKGPVPVAEGRATAASGPVPMAMAALK